MSSPQKWLSYLDEPLLEEVGLGQTTNPFFWCGQGIDQPDVSGSVEIDGPNKDMDEQEKLCPRKRPREESSGGPGSKACREKMRRDRLNDRFMELSSVLEPGRPPKTDKATILSDATRAMNQLRAEAQKLKDSNDQLQEAIKDLKAEKNELRDEKLRLKAEKERLEQQVKAMTLPSGFVPHPAAFHAAAAFAAQSQAAANKTMPVPGYPGMAMWQWMPPAVVDTSQDHVLRPPVA
nr:bHLH family transcription factor [Larix gmelinii var. olgensis]